MCRQRRDTSGVAPGFTIPQQRYTPPLSSEHGRLAAHKIDQANSTSARTERIGPARPGRNSARPMNYDEIEHLRADHPAWSLLRSPNAALVMSFFGRVFVDANTSDIPAGELTSELDDELYALNERLVGDRAEHRFPKPAAEYLDDWAAPERGWLRKYYPPGSDEPRYDLSPAVEQALMWVSDLRTREFIGTESRLNTIFDLLRQMVFGAESDPERRLTELRRRRAELDEEISRVERGEFNRLDSVSQRDRYQQFSRTARELLSDFRQVEENFRKLDRQLRQQIAGWTGPKGALLDEATGSRHGIAESDQGRSFQSFYDLLLSHRRQAELSDLLQRLQQVDEIPDHDDRLAHIHFDWIDASAWRASPTSGQPRRRSPAPARSRTGSVTRRTTVAPSGTVASTCSGGAMSRKSRR
jgi:hypothetical protein